MTILLVSHDTNTITSFCDRAVLLENGRVYTEGDPKKVSVIYHNLLFGNRNSAAEKDTTHQDQLHTPSVAIPKESHQQDVVFLESQMRSEMELPNNRPTVGRALRYGSNEARLIDWALVDEHGNRSTVIRSGSSFKLYMVLACERDIVDLSCGFAIKDRRGTVLWGITNVSQNLTTCKAEAGECLTISVEGVMWLAAGDYFITLGAAHLENGEKIDFLEDALEFKVLGPGGIFTTSTVNLQTVFKMCSDHK